MTNSEQRGLAHARRVVAGVAEEVFATVTLVHDEALRCHREAVARGQQLRGRDISALGSRIQELLQEPGRIVTGLGMIMAPDALADQPLRLEWWQLEPGRDLPVALKVDLNPSSLGFYDYATAEWFDIPRRSGRRHIVGPYVDVHGTGRYVLTFTMPVEADGAFLGVVGADVPAARLEARLLPELGRDPEMVVLDAEDRVVLSTSRQWLAGTLMPVRPDDEPVVSRVLPGLPWRLRGPATRDPGDDPKPLTS